MKPRPRFPRPALLAGVLVGLLILAGVAASLTRTRWGRERVLALTLTTLGGRLNGQLVVARLEGNLFTGARLYGIVLRQPDGRILLEADSADIDYRLPTFFRGDVEIRRLVVYDAGVALRRLPTDSLWNYQQVLLDTTRAAGPGRATIIDRLTVVNGSVAVEIPWEPEEGLSPAEQRAETRRVLSDTSRVAVARAPGGYLRTITAHVDRGTLEALTIASDERGGNYLRVVAMRGTVNLYRGEPLRLRDVQGELALREGVIRYRVPAAVMPASRVASEGSIDIRGEVPKYDVFVQGRDVALADVNWMYPPFPDRGSATFRLWLETRPEGDYYRLSDLDVATPGNRLTGRFGVVVGDTMRFEDVSLVADPLDVRTVERMLPGGVPVRGLQIGSVRIDSPAS